MQRAVIKSGIYSAKTAGLTAGEITAVNDEWNALNTLGSTAEQNAKAAIENIQKGTSDGTKYQKNFLVNQNATTWGYVVEEQLNILVGTGWNKQAVLDGSRPDYKKNVDGVVVYADLTTPKEAGNTGDHVTIKLLKGKINPGTAVAADITHGKGQVAQVPLPDWRMDALAARQLHKASTGKGKFDGAYSQWAEQTKVPEQSDIMSYSKKKCEQYATAVRENIDLDQFEDDEEEEDYDEEDDYDDSHEEDESEASDNEQDEEDDDEREYGGLRKRVKRF